MARRLLSRRSSCVFTPPLRPNLDAATRQEASDISMHIRGKGVGAQHFGIYAFAREWDEFLQSEAEARSRVFEVIPNWSSGA